MGFREGPVGDKTAQETSWKEEHEIAKLLTSSDAFARHGKVFIKVSQDLIERRQCTAQDFEDIGGWAKSTNFPNRPVYFMYCGCLSKADRVYVDAAKGKTFGEVHARSGHVAPCVRV